MNTHQSHVQCQACGSRYIFATSAIQAPGYEAECDDCHTHFWIDANALLTYDPAEFALADGPAPVVTPTLSANGRAHLQCAHCAAVYEFAVSELPKPGFEAACEACSKTFVLGTPAAVPAPTPVAPKPIAPAPIAVAPVTPPMSDPAPVSVAALSARSVAQPTAALEIEAALFADSSSAPPVEHAFTATSAHPVRAPADRSLISHDPLTMMMLDQQLGEPDPAIPGSSLQHDFALIAQHRRRRHRIIGAVAVVGMGALISVVFYFWPAARAPKNAVSMQSAVPPSPAATPVPPPAASAIAPKPALAPAPAAEVPSPTLDPSAPPTPSPTPSATALPATPAPDTQSQLPAPIVAAPDDGTRDERVGKKSRLTPGGKVKAKAYAKQKAKGKDKAKGKGSKAAGRGREARPYR